MGLSGRLEGCVVPLLWEGGSEGGKEAASRLVGLNKALEMENRAVLRLEVT